MQFRKLGRTGMEVSAVGFGGIPIMGARCPVGCVPEEEAVRVVRYALDKGITFIDTARSYSDSERRIGMAIKGRSPRPFIATKTYIDPKGQDLARFSREIDDSLAALDVDAIDLYQIHYIDRGFELAFGPDGAVAQMQKAKAAGKIRHIGVTAHDPEIAIKALESGEFETIQVPYNIVKPQAAEKLFPYCLEHGIGVICMKPIAGGALATPHEVQQWLEGKDLPTATAALRFVLSQPAVSVAIPGMDSTLEVDENVAVAAGEVIEPLGDAEAEKIRALLAPLGEQFCHNCAYCDAVCSAELPLSRIFQLERYYKLYALRDLARERFKELHRSADECLDCGKCKEKCPYGLQVPERLKEAAALLSG
jgi:predicted aldo/keto reductase-like oxidoreductase